MLRTMQALWIFAVLAGVYGAQIPLQINTRPLLEAKDWDLDRRPDVNSTSNLLFDTVSSLLQHWPNTRYRNGHNIIPGSIPIGSLLYHGTTVPEAPTVPEWLATDPEHSYLFCRGTQNAGCWHLTFAATRPLKVLYFDGSSAAKMLGGPMDSQDIMLWGKVIPERVFSERQRIDGLCEWGNKFGIDGFVRMEMDFEIMLCDFSNGLQLVSKLNLNPTGPARRPQLFPNFTSSALDVAGQLTTAVVEAGSWHNHYPGDPRIELDLSRLVSFYDSALVPSLAPLRHGQQRHEHRLEGISSADVHVVRGTISEVLTRKGGGSGVNWNSLLRVVTLRFADRLELVHHLMNITDVTPSRGTLDTAKLVQQQLRIMLAPYIINTAAPPLGESQGKSGDHSWTAPVYKYCATTHTDFIAHNPALSSALTPSELLILRAVRDTTKEICRVLVKMWAQSVAEGLDPAFNSLSSTPDNSSLENLLNRWRADISGLMGWLDWSVWIKCRPACAFEELCYLPTWPYFRFPLVHSHTSEPAATPSNEQNDWLIPQPRCVRRVAPYNFP